MKHLPPRNFFKQEIILSKIKLYIRASGSNVIHMALQYGLAQQQRIDGNSQCY